MTRGQRLSPDARRALIEEAGARLFGERGYAATRLDDIAAAAKVTKPVLYRHFDSKKGLYLALLEKHRDDLPRFVAPAAEGSVESRLREVLDGWLAYVETHGYAWKMLFRDTTGDSEIQAFRTAVQTRAREVLATLVESWSPSTPAREVEPLAEVLRTGMAGLALWWLDHPDVPRAVLVDALATVWKGLLEPPADAVA